MKKFLVFVLAIMMVLANTVLAAPVMVGTVESGEEAGEVVPAEVEASAEVMADESSLVYHFTFDDWTSSTINDDAEHNIKDNSLAATNKASVLFDDMNMRISGVNGVESGYQGNATNSVKVVVGSWKRPRLIKASNWPAGSYTVELRVYADTASNTYALYFDGETIANGATTVASGSWKTLSFSFDVGSDGYAVYGARKSNAVLRMISIPTSTANSTWHFDDLKLYYTPVAEENLIYNIDFSKLTTDDVPQNTNLSMDKLDANGGANAPDDFDGSTLSFRNTSNPSITGSHLTFSPTSDAWHRWYLNPVPAKFPEGEYTFKTYVKAAASSKYTYTINAGGEEKQYGDVTVETSWTETTCAFTVNIDEEGKRIVTYNGQQMTPGNFNYVSFAAKNHGTSWSVGYIKVYYKPFTTTFNDITLTFDANGKDVAVPEDVVIPAGSERVQDISRYTLPSSSTLKFLGWSTTADGEVVTSIDVTKVQKLYAVWDENFYPAENDYFNAGEHVFTLHFNNVTDSAAEQEIQNFGIMSDSDLVTSGSENKYGFVTGQQRLISYFSANKSTNLEYLKANAGKDIDLVLESARNAGTADHFQVGVKSFKGTVTDTSNDWGESNFVDGIYTFTAELFVEENPEIEEVQYYGYAYDRTGGAFSGGFKAMPVGEKANVKTSILIKNGVAYDYDTMTPMTRTSTTAVANVIRNVSFGVYLVHAEDAEGTVEGKVHIDNLKLFYSPDTTTIKSFAENSIRTDANKGIRFKASVAQSVKADAAEYGFIVTRKSLLGSVAPNEFTKESGVTYVPGVSYNKADGTDKIYAEDDYRVDFTGVITGMPEGKANYMEDMVVRPYVTINGETTYGDAMVRSVYDTALALKAADYPDMDVEGIEKVKAIIATCEAA